VKGSPSLSLPQAARAARVGQRVLLAAIHRQELVATLHPETHRWWITPEALATWRRRRRPPTSESAA